MPGPFWPPALAPGSLALVLLLLMCATVLVLRIATTGGLIEPLVQPLPALPTRRQQQPSQKLMLGL